MSDETQTGNTSAETEDTAPKAPAAEQAEGADAGAATQDSLDVEGKAEDTGASAGSESGAPAET